MERLRKVGLVKKREGDKCIHKKKVVSIVGPVDTTWSVRPCGAVWSRGRGYGMARDAADVLLVLDIPNPEGTEEDTEELQSFWNVDNENEESLHDISAKSDGFR